MSETVIKSEGLGKKYIIGHQGKAGYKTFREQVGQRVHNFYSRTKKLVSGQEVVEGDEVEEFWALKDLNFEIKKGDRVGIIGKNGAGKSTLLKVLSRITEPTTGKVFIKGRVASLLEVGTGFHPELTGRENIFLNGAIMGMSRMEIKRKFDEIVDFSGVEKFLDTPVKRYSSGMYVRLAFSVAAHLEPEILVVDEVLAVGDAEFQKKCLGKMSEVARGGRTVVFVSHNMAAMKSLTSRGIVLDAGRVVFSGTIEQVIQHYAQLISRGLVAGKPRLWRKGKHTAIHDVRLLSKDDHQPTTQYVPGEPLIVELTIGTDGTPGMSLELFLTDASRTRIGVASTYLFHGQTLPETKGVYRATIKFDPLWLAAGGYAFDVATSIPNTGWDHLVESAVGFEVQFSNALGYPWDFKQSYGYGFLTLLCRPPAEFLFVGN